QARPADRRGVQAARRGDRLRGAALMGEVEVSNRRGLAVGEDAAAALARQVLAAEGVGDGELGLAFVGTDEMRALKRDHLGIDEATDVLSFTRDGLDEL